MKKKIKKIVSLGLAAIMSVCITACNSTKTPDAPDYSNSGLSFEYWGYSAMNNGTYTIDGEVIYVGQDFRTVEKYKEYKDAGMTVFFPQTMALYNGEDWETSITKETVDKARQAGMEKTIIQDYRIQLLASDIDGDSLIGTGNVVNKNGKVIRPQFASQAELDAYVTECFAPYRDYPGIYGVMLTDEPYYDELNVVGELYQAMKRCWPELFVQLNLSPPLLGWKDLYAPNDQPVSTNFYENWRMYLNKWLDASKADYFMYDQYPLNTEHGVYSTYMRGLQIAAEVARDRNVSFKHVTQTCAYGTTEVPTVRAVKERDCYFLMNLLAGYGVDTVAYFTYWTKQTNTTGKEVFQDGSSFMTRLGEKTDIYYNMQKIMGEMQKLAPTILSFDYQANAYFRKVPLEIGNNATNACKNDTLTKIKNVDIDKELCLITELKNKQTQDYMYMIMNTIDPKNVASNPTFETIKVTFASEYTHALVFDKGEQSVVKLKNGVYTVKLHPGAAVYVIPFH